MFTDTGQSIIDNERHELDSFTSSVTSMNSVDSQNSSQLLGPKTPGKNHGFITHLARPSFKAVSSNSCQTSSYSRRYDSSTLLPISFPVGNVDMCSMSSSVSLSFLSPSGKYSLPSQEKGSAHINLPYRDMHMNSMDEDYSRTHSNFSENYGENDQDNWSSRLMNIEHKSLQLGSNGMEDVDKVIRTLRQDPLRPGMDTKRWLD